MEDAIWEGQAKAVEVIVDVWKWLIAELYFEIDLLLVARTGP